MPQRSQGTLLCQLVTGLLAKFAQGDLFGPFRVRICRRRVDLTGRHFPNRLTNGNAFLINQNEPAVARHGSNHHRSLAAGNGPCARAAMHRRSHLLGHNFQMRIGKMPLARESFPGFLLHLPTVAASAGAGNPAPLAWPETASATRLPPNGSITTVRRFFESRGIKISKPVPRARPRPLRCDLRLALPCNEDPFQASSLFAAKDRTTGVSVPSLLRPCRCRAKFSGAAFAEGNRPDDR